MKTEEEIHEIRLAIKRINALADFLDTKEYFRKEFRELGKARNKQIIFSLLIKYSPVPIKMPSIKYPEVGNPEKIFDRLEKLQNKLEKTQNKDEKFLLFRDKSVQFIKRGKDLHEIRRKVKTLYFLQKELIKNKITSGFFGNTELKNLEHELGLWHDIDLLMNYLKKKKNLECRVIRYLAREDYDRIEDNVRKMIDEIFRGR